jgi:hypothetical protein
VWIKKDKQEGDKEIYITYGFITYTAHTLLLSCRNKRGDVEPHIQLRLRKKKKGVQNFMGDRGGGCELMETVAGFRIVSTLTVGL